MGRSIEWRFECDLCMFLKSLRKKPQTVAFRKEKGRGRSKGNQREIDEARLHAAEG